MFITPKQRDKTTADIRKRGKTCAQGKSQRSRSRDLILRAANQSIQIPKAFSIPEREMLENNGKDKLENNRTGER